MMRCFPDDPSPFGLVVDGAKRCIGRGGRQCSGPGSCPGIGFIRPQLERRLLSRSICGTSFVRRRSRSVCHLDLGSHQSISKEFARSVDGEQEINLAGSLQMGEESQPIQGPQKKRDLAKWQQLPTWKAWFNLSTWRLGIYHKFVARL